MTPEETLQRNGWVRQLARALVRDATRAEDVAQEAQLAAWRASRRESGVAEPSVGWWRGVVRRLAALEWRRETRLQRRERTAARSEALPATVDIAADFERHREVVAAVDALPEPFREALLLRFFEGLPPRALATRLGLPVRTVESRIARGLEKLRAELIGGSGERHRSLAALAFAGGGAVGMKTGGTVLVAAGALVLAGLTTWWFARPVAPSLEHVDAARGATADATAASTDPAFAEGATRVEQRESTASATPPAEPAAPVASIRGSVVLHDQPFAGATVALFRREGQEATSNDWEELAREEPIASATTGADGRFAFAHEPAGSTFLRATAASDLRSAAIAAEPGGELVVRLLAAASLSGTVVRAEDGAPVEHALVSLTNVDTLRDVVTTLTDADGHYSFTALDPGSWRASVVARDGTATTPRNFATAAPDSRFRLAAGSPLTADFELGGGAVLSGRVTDAASGLPIAGARLTLPLFAPAAGVGPVTAADGIYRWSGLRLVGLQTVAVTAPGYGTAIETLFAGPDGELTLDFALSRAASVRGRVVDAAGRPLANAQLRTAATAPPRAEQRSMAPFGGAGLSASFDVEERSTRSDANGRFEIARLSADRVHWLRVRAPGRAEALLVLPELAPDQALELPDLQLQPAAELRGSVVSTTGEPLRAFLEFAPSGDAIVGFRDPLPPRSATIDAWLTGRVVTTAADGSFRFDRLAAGRWKLRVRSEEAVAALPDRAVDIPAGGGSTTLPPLVLDTGLRLAGRLVTTDGSPVGGARITVHVAAGAPTRLHETVAAADGSFEVRGLAMGTYVVQVGQLDAFGSDESGESAVLFTRVQPVEAGRTDVLVRVEVGRWIGGIVRHRDGRATGPLRVRASWSETRLGPETRTDEWGRFRLLVPRRGELRIAVSSMERSSDGATTGPLAKVTIDEVAAQDERPIELLLAD